VRGCRSVRRRHRCSIPALCVAEAFVIQELQDLCASANRDSGACPALPASSSSAAAPPATPAPQAGPLPFVPVPQDCSLTGNLIQGATSGCPCSTVSCYCKAGAVHTNFTTCTFGVKGSLAPGVQLGASDGCGSCACPELSADASQLCVLCGEGIAACPPQTS